MARTNPLALTVGQKNALKALSLSKVQKFEDAVYSDDQKKIIARTQKAYANAKTNFTDNNWRKAIATLLSDVFEVPMNEIAPELSPKTQPIMQGEAAKGIAVIILTKDASHNYDINRPAFIIGEPNSGCACRQFDDVGLFSKGNNPPNAGEMYNKHWRYATADEINAEFERIMALNPAVPEDANLVLV